MSKPMSSIAGRSPTKLTRGFIRNLDMGGKAVAGIDPDFSFWFRPTPVKETVKANYEKMRVMGMSHQYPVYSGTENLSFSFDLYVNALMLIREASAGNDNWNGAPTGSTPKEGGQTDRDKAVKMIQDGRTFLHALNYPAEGPSGIIGSRTPVIILCLPNICTLRGQLTGLDVNITDVFIDGAPKELTASVSFEELPMARVSMEDVLTTGMVRTWGAM